MNAHMKQYRSFLFGVGMILLFVMSSVSSGFGQTTTRSVSLSCTGRELQADRSDPGLITFTFEGATVNDSITAHVYLLSNGTLTNFTDSYGEPQFDTQRVNNKTVAVSIRSGTFSAGSYDLRIDLNFTADPEDNEVALQYNTEIFTPLDQHVRINASLEILDADGGSSRRTYTTDDLRGMSFAEVIEFFVYLFVNSFGWILILIIMACSCQRYIFFRKFHKV